MRVSFFITGLMASSALAAPVISAVKLAQLLNAVSTNPIIEQLKLIDADNVNNKKLLDSFEGTIDVAAAIQTNSEKIAKDVAALKDIVKTAPNLTIEEAVELGKVSDQMSKDVAAGLDALVAKKSQFDAIGVSSVVLSQLKAQSKGGDDGTAAVQAKLPKEVQSYASSTPDVVAQALKKAIEAFSVEAPEDDS